MLENLKDRVLKQRTIGGWGRFSLAASQISIFVTTLTLLMVTVNAYAPISLWLVEHNITLSFWMFISIVIVPIMIAYFLAWKYLVSSFYRSSTEQFWMQSKPLLDKLDSIKEVLDDELPEIKKRLDTIEADNIARGNPEID